MNPKLSLIILLIATAQESMLGQGAIQWGNHFTGTLQAPVYGVIPGHEVCRLNGNTPMGIPAGTQDYGGAPLLAGTGYTLAIYLGNSPAEAAANNIALDQAPFRTGGAAGLIFARSVVDPFRPPGTTGVHVQFRAWDNRNGTITSWSQVMASGGSVAFGDSGVFPLGPLGGRDAFGIDHMTPQTLGARSFNLYVTGGSPGCPVPEPSTWLIIAMSAGLFLLIRHRRATANGVDRSAAGGSERPGP